MRPNAHLADRLNCDRPQSNLPLKPANIAGLLLGLSISAYSAPKDDLHAVSMALKIGRMLSDAGAEVTLFADLEGVRLGDRRAPQNLLWGSGKPGPAD